MKRIFLAFLLLFSFAIVKAQYLGGGFYKFDGNFDANGVKLDYAIASSSPMVFFNANQLPISNSYHCSLSTKGDFKYKLVTPELFSFVEVKGNWNIYTYRWYSGERSYVLVSLDGRKIRYISYLEKNGRYTEYVYYGKKEYNTDELPLH